MSTTTTAPRISDERIEQLSALKYPSFARDAQEIVGFILKRRDRQQGVLDGFAADLKTFGVRVAIKTYGAAAITAEAVVDELSHLIDIVPDGCTADELFTDVEARLAKLTQRLIDGDGDAENQAAWRKIRAIYADVLAFRNA